MSSFKLTPDEIYGLMSSKDTNQLSSLGSLEGVANNLNSSLKEGLPQNGADLSERKRIYGTNTYPLPPPANWFVLFAEAFTDPAVIILSVAAIISLVAGVVEQVLGEAENGWIEGVAIITAVFIVATVTATNDYTKDQQFRKLKKQTADYNVRVVRDGEETEISVLDIVVGDVCVLHQGDKIPADGLFIPGIEELKVDESSMTGEPESQSKNKNKPFVWSGTNIAKGAGTMLVLQVGVNSEWGRTLHHLSEEQEDTPLQVKLGELVIFVGKIGSSVALLVFIVLMAYYINDYVVYPTKDWVVGKDCGYNDTIPFNETSSTNETLPLCPADATPKEGYPGVLVTPDVFHVNSLLHLLHAFIVSITIVVVAVPEGLPLAVTISLAYSMKLMTKDQNLVRHLSACETMGGATNICSDKTGTLTMNRMTVVSGWAAGSPFTRDDMPAHSKAVQKLFIDSLCLNLEDAFIEKTDIGFKFSGSTTECAMLVFAEKLGANVKNIQTKATRVYKWGFSSARKRMSTLYENDDGTFRLYVKGAAEIVLGLCVNALESDGSETNLTHQMRSELNTVIEDNARKGLRNLVLATRQFGERQQWDASPEGEGYEEDLTFVGIISIEDPVRPEVPKSVRLCQEAGIRVRMVTGDNLLTARKIAEECNIFTEGGLTMEGPEFRKLSDDEVKQIFPGLQVLARSSPTDKHRLVTLLKETGEVVAVTGDGTNDAPALKAANVGLAMGITGTDVAKEAADIIILDDNFASIVKSVMWGRCVFDNIRKFIQFQMTVNVCALITAFIGAVAKYGTPLTAVQLLWVNLIMDTMAALALGTEKPTPDLLYRKPYGKSSRLITWLMWRFILGQALLQIAALCFILYAVDKSTGHHLLFTWVPIGNSDAPNTQYTMLFNTFVLFQLFNEFNARILGNGKNIFRGLGSNWIYISVLIGSIAVQVILVQFGGLPINTSGLGWEEWLVCLFIASLSWPWGFMLRFIPVPYEDWEIASKDPADFEKL